ncbi:MAG: 16S rRNA (guanine(527)-N(7))-methyltransferase RsmG [Paracoccaceae bacterium]|nr:16S rRNA (guanine(527)-N(7))-methyltransferase RsmG [Paracoccaceae bacterium]
MKHDLSKNVSRETFSLLERLAALVEKWNKSINLISKSTVPNLWERHILDSVQIYHATQVSFKRWLDIGSGAGFPGLVLAILAKEKNIDGEIILVESDKRKCAFLYTVRRDLNLNLSIINKRIEECDPQNADIISARALANLTKLFDLSFNHKCENTTFIFPKGRSWQEELVAAEKTWNFSWEAVNSITDSQAVVLKIGELSRAKY